MKQLSMNDDVKTCNECFYAIKKSPIDSDGCFYICEHPYGIEYQGRHNVGFFLHTAKVVEDGFWKSKNCPWDKIKKQV